MNQNILMLKKTNFKSQSKKLALTALVASSCSANALTYGQIIENRDVPAIEFGHVHRPYESDSNATNVAPTNCQATAKVPITQPIAAPLQIPLRATPALNLASPVETPEVLTKPAPAETSSSPSSTTPTTEATPIPGFVPWSEKKTSTMNTASPGYTPPDGAASSETTIAPIKY